jgi:hypothetical protein
MWSDSETKQINMAVGKNNINVDGLIERIRQEVA